LKVENNNNNKSAASVCHHVAALGSDMFLFGENQKITNNSTTMKAREIK
jgi:hypothetical protein